MDEHVTQSNSPLKMSTSQPLELETRRPSIAKVTVRMWFRLQNLSWQRVLDDPTGPSITVSPSKQRICPTCGERETWRRSGRCKLLALNTEEEDWEPRDVGGGARRARKGEGTNSSLEPPERNQPCQHLDLGPGRAVLNLWPVEQEDNKLAY